MHRGYVTVVLCALIIIAGFPAHADSLSLFKDHLFRDASVGSAEAFRQLCALAMVAAALSMPACGHLVDALGGCRALIAATVPFCVAIASIGMFGSWWQLFLAIYGMKLLGVGVLNLIVTVLVNRWFVQLRGAASSSLTLLAAALMPGPASLAAALIPTLGWRGASMVLSLCSALALFVGWAGLRDSPEAEGLKADCMPANAVTVSTHDSHPATPDCKPLALASEAASLRTEAELDAAIATAAEEWRERVERQRRQHEALEVAEESGRPGAAAEGGDAEGGGDGWSCPGAMRTAFFWSVCAVHLVVVTTWTAVALHLASGLRAAAGPSEAAAESLPAIRGAGAAPSPGAWLWSPLVLAHILAQVAAAAAGALALQCYRRMAHRVHALLGSGPCVLACGLLLGAPIDPTDLAPWPVGVAVGALSFSAAMTDSVVRMVFAEVYGHVALGRIAGVVGGVHLAALALGQHALRAAPSPPSAFAALGAAALLAGLVELLGVSVPPKRAAGRKRRLIVGRLSERFRELREAGGRRLGTPNGHGTSYSAVSSC